MWRHRSWAHSRRTPIQARISKFDQRCKITWLRCLFRGGGGGGGGGGGNWPWPSWSNFDLECQIFSFHHYWKNITTTKPPENHAYLNCFTGLFHGLHPLHMLIYLDCFTVPTVSQSQHAYLFALWQCVLRLWNSPWFVSMLFRDCFTVPTPVHMETAQPKWNETSTAEALKLNWTKSSPRLFHSMTVSQYDNVAPYTDLGGRGYFGV